MKWITIVGLALSICAGAQEKELTLPLSDPGKRASLKVNIKYGDVIVKGTDRKDILLRYKVKENGNKEEKSKEGLKRVVASALDLDVVEMNNKVTVNSDTYGRGQDIYMEVPRNIDVDLGTYNQGEVRVSNINGEVELDNQNGPITALNINGSVVAHTYNGTVKVVFSNITEDTPMSFVTYNGDVDLTMPENAKFDLKMKTARGEIYTGFDMEMIEGSPQPEVDSKKGYKVYIDEWVRSKVNKGGEEIVTKTYNGDIYIRKEE